MEAQTGITQVLVEVVGLNKPRVSRTVLTLRGRLSLTCYIELLKDYLILPAVITGPSSKG